MAIFSRSASALASAISVSFFSKSSSNLAMRFSLLVISALVIDALLPAFRLSLNICSAPKRISISPFSFTGMVVLRWSFRANSNLPLCMVAVTIVPSISLSSALAFSASK